MKYLKLITEPQLPEGKHITFAYFGQTSVSQSQITKYLSEIEVFNLTDPKNDMFGPNNDIPCVTFNKDNSVISAVSTIRKNMLLSLGTQISDQNRLEWAPHISNVTLDEMMGFDNYKVIGVKSNDGLFGIYF
jgi:hypothetical protein